MERIIAMANIALLIAGGAGARMHQNIPKQFLTVNERPVIVYTLEAFQQHPEIDVLSGTVAEFEGSALTAEDAKQQVVSLKFVPETDREIAEYIKFRNPINHPCVMFRKSKAAAAGGYQQCHMFEDYDLWVRMFKNKGVFANLTDTILYMRVNNMHMRRGGISYAKAVLHFWSRMYRQKMIGLPQYIFIIALRIIISLCPNQFRKMVYDKRLRNHSL